MPECQVFPSFFAIASCLAVAKTYWFHQLLQRCSTISGKSAISSRHFANTLFKVGWSPTRQKDWTTRRTALAVNSSMLTFGRPAFIRVFFNIGRCFAARCRQRKTELPEVLQAFAVRKETFFFLIYGLPIFLSFSKNQQQKQSKLSLYETSFLGPYQQW